MTSEESRRVRNTLEDKRLGLKYGPGDGDKVDLFGEEGREPVVMVYIFGGYWQEMSRDLHSHTSSHRWSQVSVSVCKLSQLSSQPLPATPRLRGKVSPG